MLYFVLNLHLKARGFCWWIVWVSFGFHQPTIAYQPSPFGQVDYLFNGISGKNHCFSRSKKQSNSYVPWLRHLQIQSFVNVFIGFTNAVHQNLYTSLHIYHLEKKWHNCHVLVYHGPLLNHLWGGLCHLLHYGVFGIIWNLHSVKIRISIMGYDKPYNKG